MPQYSEQNKAYWPVTVGVNELEPKGWYIEAMDDVIGGHQQFNGVSHWYVQFVDLALSIGMLQLPHPLFSEHVDVKRYLGRWRRLLGGI